MRLRAPHALHMLPVVHVEHLLEMRRFLLHIEIFAQRDVVARRSKVGALKRLYDDGAFFHSFQYFPVRQCHGFMWPHYSIYWLPRDLCILAPLEGISDKQITALSGTSNGARGKFIIFEGGEGSGKTTIVDRLKEKFPNIVYTQGPGGTDVGERVRDLLMSKATSGIDARTELLLFLASRAQLVAEVIRPALISGKNVICNRFGLSSIAYQVYGRQNPNCWTYIIPYQKRYSTGACRMPVFFST